MKIFVGGSRYLDNNYKFDSEFINFLSSHNFINHNNDFIVGDANGADKLFQQVFLKSKLQNVNVFFSNNNDWRIRNFLDKSWKKIPVLSSLVGSDFDLRHQKDLSMVGQCDLCIMYWNPIYLNRFGINSVSKGSLLNIYNALSNKKTSYMYDCNLRKIEKFNDISDFINFLKVNYNNIFDKIQNIFIDEKRRIKNFHIDRRCVQSSLFK